jgi:hypothetical protein
MKNVRITHRLTLIVLPPERRCGGVVVIALCCADCSTELSGVAHVPRKPTNNLDHLLTRNSLGAALAMIGAHAFRAGTLVLLATDHESSRRM